METDDQVIIDAIVELNSAIQLFNLKVPLAKDMDYDLYYDEQYLALNDAVYHLVTDRLGHTKSKMIELVDRYYQGSGC